MRNSLWPNWSDSITKVEMKFKQEMLDRSTYLKGFELTTLKYLSTRSDPL